MSIANVVYVQKPECKIVTGHFLTLCERSEAEGFMYITVTCFLYVTPARARYSGGVGGVGRRLPESPF